MGLSSVVRRYIREDDWVSFWEQCAIHNIWVLHKTVLTLNLAIFSYGILIGSGSVAGLGISLPKLRRAKRVVLKVLSIKLREGVNREARFLSN